MGSRFRWRAMPEVVKVKINSHLLEWEVNAKNSTAPYRRGTSTAFCCIYAWICSSCKWSKLCAGLCKWNKLYAGLDSTQKRGACDCFIAGPSEHQLHSSECVSWLLLLPLCRFMGVILNRNQEIRHCAMLSQIFQ